MPLSHLLRLSAITPHNKTEGGERIKADAAIFPILRGMSLYKLLLRPKGVREPHWHPNADEFGYCLKGEVLVTFYHTDNNKQTFLVRDGDAFWIPSGALHTLENVGHYNAELLLEFTTENPEEFHLSSTMGMFSNAVLGNTWGVGSDHFQAFRREPKESFAFINAHPRSISNEAKYANRYRFALEETEPLIDCKGGSVRVARQNVWPILRSHALYSLRIEGCGMREPHWHPETAELGFVQTGHARMTIRAPTGKIDTYKLMPGDLYFIPKAYPHHIENIGKEALHFLLYFDQPMPKDVGFSASVKGMGDDLLASLFRVNPKLFETLPTYFSDRFIVEKNNPLDPT